MTPFQKLTTQLIESCVMPALVVLSRRDAEAITKLSGLPGSVLHSLSLQGVPVSVADVPRSFYITAGISDYDVSMHFLDL